MLNRIASDNIAKQISISWGVSEFLSDGQEREGENSAFMMMAAQGQSVYVASGDNGSAQVNDPASQPYVVAVGGTELFVSGTYDGEIVWTTANGLSSAGGISRYWPLPNYQPANVSGGSGGSATFRNVPDVSLCAGPFAIYYRGGWAEPSGTSGAAPLWAAYTSLVNQARTTHGLGSLGFPNPTLYSLAQSSRYYSDFHDITVGNNGTYSAVPGYDNVTGWGSFNGGNLFNDLEIDAIILHVDGNFNGSPQTGTVTNPFRTVTAAINAAPANQSSLINIKGYSYLENITITKNVLLVNEGGGAVRIGN